VKKILWQTLTTALVLATLPAQAMAKTSAAPTEWRKGETVLTPINDSYDDIVRAATQAEAVVARTATITDLAALPMPAPIALPSYIPAPLAGATQFASISPVLVPDEQNLLPYAGLAGLMLPALLIGSGDGGSSGEIGTLPGSGESADVPAPSPVPQPLLAVPEPATWLMLLLGFGAVGSAVRRARQSGMFAPAREAALTTAG